MRFVLKAINIRSLLALNEMDLSAFQLYSAAIETAVDRLNHINLQDKGVCLALAFHHLIVGNTRFRKDRYLIKLDY